MLDRQLSARLDTVCRRQRVRALTDAGISAAVAALGVYALLEALSRAVGFVPQATWIGAAAAALAAFAAAARRPYSRLDAAALADNALKLQDRIAAAVEFSGLVHRGSALVTRLQEDAARYAERIDPRQLVPYRLPRRAALIPLLLALALAVRTWVPPAGSPSDRSDLTAPLTEAEERALRQTAEALAEAAALEDRPEYLQLASLLRQLLDRLTRGELSPEEFRQQLAAVEDLLNAYADRSAEAANRPPQQAGTPAGTQVAAGDAGRQSAEPPQRAADPADRGAGGDPGLDAADDEAANTEGRSTQEGGEPPRPGGSASAEGEPDAQAADALGDAPGAEASAAPGTDAPQAAEADGSDVPGADAGFGGGDEASDPAARPETDGVRVGLTGAADLSEAGVRPLSTMTVPGGSQPSSAGGPDFAPAFSGGEEHSVVYESVPPALRPWVQRYFEAIFQN